MTLAIAAAVSPRNVVSRIASRPMAVAAVTTHSAISARGLRRGGASAVAGAARATSSSRMRCSLRSLTNAARLAADAVPQA